MEVMWLPVPLPSLVAVAPDGSCAPLRAARQRMAVAIRAAALDAETAAALAAVSEYEAMLTANRGSPAGVVWDTPNGAVCSFEREGEVAMLAHARAALCVRAATTTLDGDARCEYLAEALAAVRAGPRCAAVSAREDVLCALLHAEFVSVTLPLNAGAWRAVHALATAGAKGLAAAGDAAGTAAAEALATEALSRACEAAAEERYKAAKFAEAAELGAAGRPAFAERAEQLHAMAAQRSLPVRKRSALEMIDMLPPAATLPSL